MKLKGRDMNKILIMVFVMLLFTTPKINAQSNNKGKDVKYGHLPQDEDTKKSMDEFRQYGLGQFIHWGVYAIPGNEWEGVSAKEGAPASEWIRAWSGDTKPEDWESIYDNLYKDFDPKDFNPKKWAKQAKEMGAKYVIFTTKHHDGFALWPTEYSDYNIMNSPYKKDIVKQVVDAYAEEDIDVFLYFSVMDWNHPNYRAAEPKTEKEKKEYDKFLEYTRNQLFELVNNYPKMKGLWFDGTWDPAWKASYKFAYNLEKELREKHPGLIIGSRFRNDEYGATEFDTNGELLGDYLQKYERKFPENIDSLKGNDFDVIMTIPPNGWGYMKDWSGLYTKTPDDLIKMLMKAKSMSGNFVLNLGPDGYGNFKDEENEIMKDIGDWVETNSEAIYGTEHANVPRSDYGYFTQKDKTLYLTVFNRPVNDIVRIAIDKETDEVPVSAALLKNNKDLEMKHSKIGLDLDKNTYFDIQLPEDFKTNQPFVIKIDLKEGHVDDRDLMDAKT